MFLFHFSLSTVLQRARLYYCVRRSCCEFAYAKRRYDDVSSQRLLHKNLENNALGTFSYSASAFVVALPFQKCAKQNDFKNEGENHVKHNSWLMSESFQLIRALIIIAWKADWSNLKTRRTERSQENCSSRWTFFKKLRVCREIRALTWMNFSSWSGVIFF